MSEGDYFTTFDLSSGYHHIEIHPEHQKFLSFESSFEDGSTKYFQFCVLHSVCHLHVTFFEFQASRSFELAKTAGELVKNDLVSTGFVINVEKSDFTPKTKGKWLGTITDTIKMIFTIPSEKINKLLANIKNILDAKRFSS